MFTAIVLNEDDRQFLLDQLQELGLLKTKYCNGGDWETVASHSTLNMGPNTLFKELEGEEIEMTVRAVFYSDNIVVAKVSYDYKRPKLYTQKRHAHITVQINRANGIKPKDADVVNWRKALYLKRFQQFDVYGILQEHEANPPRD